MVSVSLVMWLFSSTIVTSLGQECDGAVTPKACVKLCKDSTNCESITSVDLVDKKKSEFCDSENAVCQFIYACKPGYTINRDKTKCRRQNPCKQDVHLCDANRGGCHIKRTCNDNSGKIVCGNCPAGYLNDGEKGCKEIEAHEDMVCNVDDGEVWMGQPDTDTFEECKQSCLDTKDCNSVSYYHHGGCSHWKSMCKSMHAREGVRSKNVRGESLNKKECDVNNGEHFIGKLNYWVSHHQCQEACINHGECNSFTYYNHGACSFFSSCCHNTRIVDNAHSERWRLPEYY